MSKISQEELGVTLEHFATMEACVTCMDILHRIESMLEAGDNPLAKNTTKAIEAVLELYQQAATHTSEWFWDNHV